MGQDAFHTAPGVPGPSEGRKAALGWSEGGAGSEGKESPFLLESSCIGPLV